MFAGVVLALAMTPACAATLASLHRAEADWTAFVRGDFVNAAPAAEARRLRAKDELDRADRLAAGCRDVAIATERIELHYEVDLVDVRRARGSGASLAAVSGDLVRLRDLGLAASEPERYRFYASRFAEVQAETRGGLIVPLPPAGAPGGTPAAARSSGCALPDSPPVPRSSIVPIGTDPARVRGPHGSTAVSVQVSSTGSVLSVVTVMSSGDSLLDQAVADAVRLVTFVPARRQCADASGEYRFTHTFP